MIISVPSSGREYCPRCSSRDCAGEMPMVIAPAERAALEIRSGKPVVAPVINTHPHLAIFVPNRHASDLRSSARPAVANSLDEPITPILTLGGNVFMPSKNSHNKFRSLGHPSYRKTIKASANQP